MRTILNPPSVCPSVGHPVLCLPSVQSSSQADQPATSPPTGPQLLAALVARAAAACFRSWAAALATECQWCVWYHGVRCHPAQHHGVQHRTAQESGIMRGALQYYRHLFSIRPPSPAPRPALSVVGRSVVSCQSSISIGRLSSPAAPVHPPRCACPSAPPTAVPTHRHVCIHACVCVCPSVRRGACSPLRYHTVPDHPLSPANQDTRAAAAQDRTGQVEEGRCSAERVTRRRERKGSIFPHGTGICCSCGACVCGRAEQGQYNPVGKYGLRQHTTQKRLRERHRTARTHAQSATGMVHLYWSESTHERSGNEGKRHTRGNPSPPRSPPGSHLRLGLHVHRRPSFTKQSVDRCPHPC